MNTSPAYCEHANENPGVCPCPQHCYCKMHTCRSSDERVSWQTIEGVFHDVWGNASRGTYDKEAWNKLQRLLGQAKKEASEKPSRAPAPIRSGSFELDTERRGGSPVLPGTRFPLSQILAELAEGHSIPEIAADLQIRGDHIIGALSVLAAFLDPLRIRTEGATLEVRVRNKKTKKR